MIAGPDAGEGEDLTDHLTTVLSQSFREALAGFPSGVTVVTTRDGDGTPRGFTATAFASVSADPPMVLACLATSAECYPAFAVSDRFGISILADHHSDVASRFATRGVEKFASSPFRDADSGVPVLEEAVSTLDCRVHERIAAGDHMILLGDVVGCETYDGHQPLLYFRRTFHHLRELGHVAG